VAVNCKFIKRDARRDSDSYGKCDSSGDNNFSFAAVAAAARTSVRT